MVLATLWFWGFTDGWRGWGCCSDGDNCLGCTSVSLSLAVRLKKRGTSFVRGTVLFHPAAARRFSSMDFTSWVGSWFSRQVIPLQAVAQHWRMMRHVHMFNCFVVHFSASASWQSALDLFGRIPLRGCARKKEERRERERESERNLPPSTSKCI